MGTHAISLIRLVYSSSLRLEVSADDITEIVAVSDRRNRRVGITGMLALDGTRVCQILEGPPEAVSVLYAAIGRDRRHQGVVELSRAPIMFRAFASWGMTIRSMTIAAEIACATQRS